MELKLLPASLAKEPRFNLLIDFSLLASQHGAEGHKKGLNPFRFKPFHTVIAGSGSIDKSMPANPDKP